MNETQQHLADFIQAIAMGNLEDAKRAHSEYANMRASELINEDHDKFLTDEGILLFLKTLEKRAKKENKEEEFFKTLSSYVDKDIKDKNDFEKCVDHFSKDKKEADKFIHHVENKLKLGKDDPAKDITGKGEKD